MPRHAKIGKGSVGECMDVKGKCNSQSFQRRFNVRKLKENSIVRNIFIVEHEANAPDNGREADVLSTGQVVQNDIGFGVGGHLFRLCIMQRPRRYNEM